MPTGYTDAVQSGKITEFSDFAWRCARAFGALVMMRDSSMTAPIPERFEPDTSYFDKRIATATERLVELKAMEPAQAREAALQQHAQRYVEWNTRRQKLKAEQARYEAMLAKVEAWTPPTPDHEGLKIFMRDQLKESIRFDFYEEPEPVSPGATAFIAEESRLAHRDLDYNTAERAKEIERTEGRNRWLAELRNSLAAA